MEPDWENTVEKGNRKPIRVIAMVFIVKRF
jgi:hypothetical protein